MATLTEDEVDALLRRLVAGEITWEADRFGWSATYCGNVGFVTSDGWKVVVFNDCDEFDYIDSVESPDGRTISYDDMEGIDGYGTLPAMDAHLVDLERLAEEAQVRKA